MRIVLYSRVFPPSVGGMERFTESLADWLTLRGHEVAVITRTPDDAGSDSHRSYCVLRRPSSAQAVRAMRAADLVHINGLSLRGIGLARLAGHPPVVTHQGHQAICPTGLAWTPRGPCDRGPQPGPCSVCLERGVRGWGWVQAHRVGMHLARVNVCISHYLARRLTLPRAEVIYNPVSETAFTWASTEPGEDGLIAFAGRLVREKGLDLLLRALVRIPDARLEIAGDGPMRPVWERLVDELGLRRRVRFLGVLPPQGVAELYARASVVCVPSTWDEPYGYAAAEAMAMARPVVATPRGALPELLADGRGYVARAASPESLADALVKALNDDHGRREAATRAHAFAVSQLSLDAAGSRYLTCYERVIQGLA